MGPTVRVCVNLNSYTVALTGGGGIIRGGGRTLDTEKQTGQNRWEVTDNNSPRLTRLLQKFFRKNWRKQRCFMG